MSILRCIDCDKPVDIDYDVDSIEEDDCVCEDCRERVIKMIDDWRSHIQ